MASIDAYIFVDESKQNDGRYGGVCAISVSASHLSRIETELKAKLGDLREQKFNEMGDGRQKRAALGMLEVALKYATEGHLKIDTLTWDRHDSRHRVVGRDDYANLERMLYHRLVHVLLKWPEHRYWHLLIDRQDQVDEKMVMRTVNGRVKTKVAEELSGIFEASPEILYGEQVDSVSNIFVQLADLFAGLAVYLRELDPVDYDKGSKSKRNRSELIDRLIAWIATTTRPYFRKGEGLLTRRDSSITFWPYRPQGDYDRAPLRGSAPDQILLICTLKDCGEVFSADRAYKNALCPEHYFEKILLEEEVVARAATADRNVEGSHYCPDCVVRLTPTDRMKKLGRDYEYEYRHIPGCGGPLTEINPSDSAPDPNYSERDRPTSVSRDRPDVRLSRQNYNDD